MRNELTEIEFSLKTVLKGETHDYGLEQSSTLGEEDEGVEEGIFENLKNCKKISNQ